MPPLEIARLVLLVAHFIGLAAVIGPFLLQLRRREGLRLEAMLVGAIVQIVTGNGLIATRRLQGMTVIDEKMIVKMALAVVVLAAIVVATVVQRRRRRAGAPESRVRAWMLVGGTAAIGDVVVAVVWT